MPNPDGSNTGASQQAETGEGQDFEALYQKAQEDLRQAREDAEKWKKLSRQNESRAKINFGAAKDLEEANAQMEELSKRLAAIEGENSTLKANAAHAALVKKVAEATGVPEGIVSTLAAEDENALTAAATAIAEAYKTPGGAPKTPEGGKFPRGGENTGTAADRFSEIIQQALGR